MAQEEREVTFKAIVLQVKFTAAGVERLSQVKERLKASSFVVVVRQAFRILDIVTELLANGEELLVRNKDGTIESLNLGLDVAQ